MEVKPDSRKFYRIITENGAVFEGRDFEDRPAGDDYNREAVFVPYRDAGAAHGPTKWNLWRAKFISRVGRSFGDAVSGRCSPDN